MDKNFFNIVKDNFFRPLSGSTREVNYLILQMINKNMKDSVEYIERSEILNWIVEFCKWRPKSFMLDDETEEQVADVKKFASNKLAYYERVGWLTTERTNDFKVVYQLEPAAIEILNAMKNIEDNESRPIEYTGYVYNIFSQLMNFNIEQGTVIIEQMVEASKKLNDSLRGINNSIKKYLAALLREENTNANEILKILLEDYQKNVVARAFNNLRIKDNPSKYRNEIIDKLDELLYENFGRLTDNYIKVKYDGDRSGNRQIEAQEFIINSLNMIKEQFENIDASINVLDERNTKYVKATSARLRYLMNESIDVEGKIYDILKAIHDQNLSNEEEFEFSLKEFGRVDDSSLFSYTRRNGKAKAKVAYEKPTIDSAEIEKEKAKLLRQTQFSIISINKFICEQLGSQQSIEAKDIKINSYDDLIKLFLAQIYAGSEHVQYDVKLKDEFFEYNKSKLTNFTIERR